MPPSSRVCHNVYIHPNKAGFPCCNSPRYHWWSGSLHLKWWTVLLCDKCTTHTAKEMLYKLQYSPDLQSLERDHLHPCIKKYKEVTMLLCSWLLRLHTKRIIRSMPCHSWVFTYHKFWAQEFENPSESQIKILSPATFLTQVDDCLRLAGISIVSRGLSSPLVIHTAQEFCLDFLSYMLENTKVDHYFPLFSYMSSASVVALC